MVKNTKGLSKNIRKLLFESLCLPRVFIIGDFGERVELRRMSFGLDNNLISNYFLYLNVLDIFIRPIFLGIIIITQSKNELIKKNHDEESLLLFNENGIEGFDDLVQFLPSDTRKEYHGPKYSMYVVIDSRINKSNIEIIDPKVSIEEMFPRKRRF
ncbi:MAG: hypothetical protein N2249_05835 [Melioribacter sp.]|nr:hypothetical protein [Melioribacter sp.]